MKKTGTFVAAVALLMGTTQAFAQAAIGSPGMYSFYYPNRDVLNGGALTPSEKLETNTFTSAMNRRSDAFCTQHHHGHDGHRHPCQ
jgi:hypothetical protein